MNKKFFATFYDRQRRRSVTIRHEDLEFLKVECRSLAVMYQPERITVDLFQNTERGSVFVGQVDAFGDKNEKMSQAYKF